MGSGEKPSRLIPGKALSSRKIIRERRALRQSSSGSLQMEKSRLILIHQRFDGPCSASF